MTRFAFALIACWFAVAGATAATPPSATFNRDVAPILFEHCVECHHPGGLAPFPLVSYRDAQKRALQIARVTTTHFMPPWPPEEGHGHFVGERRLTDAQIDVLTRWAKAGAPRGAAADLKTKPRWTEGWQLGKPDLILKMPEEYTLPADGPDVYRNFVIPTGFDSDRYVLAADLQIDTFAVHHAFIYLDPRGSGRRRQAQEKSPGFPGMNPGQFVTRPSGTFASWQPGKRTMKAPDDMAWTLPKNTDLILQLHMRPTGKPEHIKVAIGLYLTDKAPTLSPVLLGLRSVDIDIPPGDGAHAVEDSYTLPVDVDVLAVLPHLHYLGREVRGWAELPDGSTQELLFIRRWNFDWQGDYRYTEPIFLPKGTRLRMRYTFDNTVGNPRNPNHPPKRVLYGLESSDEMAEFWVQLLPRRPADRTVLVEHYQRTWGIPDAYARANAMLKRDPHDFDSRTALASVLLQMGRAKDALREAKQAVADNESYAIAHTLLANICATLNDLPGALASASRAVELDPGDFQAQNNLGWFLFCANRPADAIPHLEKALELEPTDTLAQQNLERARAALKNPLTPLRR